MIINMNGAKAPETPSPVLQEKTVTPATLPTVIGADEGYTGLSQVTVNPDTNLKAENIRSGKTIFGVGGTFEGTVTQGDKLAKLIDRSITTLTVEDFGNVTKIGDYALSGCKSLTSIDIPNTVREIGINGLANCQNAIITGIGPNITRIGDYGLRDCYKITTLDLSSVTNFGTNTLFYCKGLISIVLSEELKTIPYGTFYACARLPSIVIPSKVTSIKEYVFYGCDALTSIIMKPTTPPTINGYTFYGYTVNNITVPKGSLEAYQTADFWSAYADKMVEATE